MEDTHRGSMRHERFSETRMAFLSVPLGPPMVGGAFIEDLLCT